MLLATVLAAAVTAVSATDAGSAPAKLVLCGKVSATGKTWQIATAGVACTTARKIVRAVAVKKPDRVIRAAGGEIDQYAASFSGLRCFKSHKTNVGGQIQCTSNDGKRTVLATYRG
jgi:hypothetical protein